ncbi:galactose-3-O-sulfotransferase 2-like [Salarias fasciatus]|uniref:galactose-3-O-sulfotransferase 2-like n=1 Tax=Salarias fasciatus TaxID=181472 RepID=UPI001176C33A|nr:galactose-3-O-sulfotransferase 2-like [Salarias fasciatus]
MHWAPFKRFVLDWSAAPKYFWRNKNPTEPRLQNEGSPPLVQQNFVLQQDNEITEHPPPAHGFQLKDGFADYKSQNEEAGRLKKTCQPKSHIVFLKTHKTASSTIQNILYRYGESRGLTFAFPRNKHNQLFYPGYFDRRYVNGVESKLLKTFDILCNHMRFRKPEVKKLMPQDSFYFSIVRNPVAMMESLYIYYKYLGVFRRTKSLEDFLDNGQNILSLLDNYAHNNLAFDFGFDNTATADTPDLETIVNEVITGIEQDFHLILITEYFDESMILLKHTLCWSLEDVVSFKLNSRHDQSRKSMSQITAEKIKRWNILDWRIYEHFNATFWHKVRSLVGEEEMKREVSQLKELQAKLTSICLEGGEAVNPRLIRDEAVMPFQSGTAVIQGYNLNRNLDIQTKTKCQRLIMPELQFTKLLYEKQFPETALKVVNKRRRWN